MTRYGQQTFNDTGNPGIEKYVPAVVLSDVQATAATEEVFMPLVKRIDLTGPGDAFDYPQGGALTWAAFTAGGANPPDETEMAAGARTLAPSLRVRDVVVPIDSLQGSAVDVTAVISREAGIGLAKSRDAGFAALYVEASASNPDHLGIGTDGTPLSFTSVRTILDLLYTQEAPRRFAWVVYPTQWAGELMLDDSIINASVKGAPVMTSGMGANGFVTSILDLDIYVSPQIIEATGLHSMAFSKNAALGYGYKMLTHPITGNTQEVLIDLDWNSPRRALEINMTYHADFEGIKGTSTSSNNWLVDYIS